MQRTIARFCFGLMLLAYMSGEVYKRYPTPGGYIFLECVAVALTIGAVLLFGLAIRASVAEFNNKINSQILMRGEMRQSNAAGEIIIKDTHRGLWYQDGVLTRILEAGRYVVPRYINFSFYRRPKVEVVLVDVRERDLTIKGQEILTADKVAIRVSIIVQFRVTDPRAALHEVQNYEDRLYSDVQLAARRSLASMNLEEILTNRNRLSEDILRDVQESANTYGVSILRADVKDLIFPGNLQEIMNRVLTAERLSQAQLVEARTKAEAQRIEAGAKAESRRLEAQAQIEAQRLAAQGDAEAMHIRTESETEALRQRGAVAQVYTTHPVLLRLREIEALQALSKTATARIYIGFDKHATLEAEEDAGDGSGP
ncbi:MAG: slipin family protein [Abitibacteriaceae bacterium]|nr:slipin family protein [Abditibacteriaceae bacterium]MBV9868850.1 slipin family protein [Abditibacteriaceae bacterium]